MIFFPPNYPQTAFGFSGFAIAVCIFCSAATAEVRVPALISDHMVLKRAAKVPVWGKADPGEAVAVTMGDVSANASADTNGRWSVELNLSGVKQGPFVLQIQGNNRIDVNDVVVGEVWLAGGQSNMEFPLMFANGASGEIAGTTNRFLREFRVAANCSDTPARDCRGEWIVAAPEAVGKFSAVAYFFAKNLQKELGGAVGIINASLGGTPIEAWTSAGAIDTVPELKAARERLRSALKTDNAAAPKSPSKAPDPKFVPGYLFNGMIAPLIPYAIGGVIWYQGEFNVRRAHQYWTTFPLLISDWRGHWNQGDFPFYFCQLAGFRARKPEPGDSLWAELREAQAMTLGVPNTGQAVLIDIGEAGDIHPKNKKDVGERLASIALANDYGKDIAFSGPVYQGMKTGEGRIRLTFAHSEDGLVAKPLPATYDIKTKSGETAPLVRNSPDSELEGFATCGTDHKWVWADAKIDGDSVVVWSDKIPEPVAVRYAWADNPACNLYNKAGFPASPFRTDNEPGLTLHASY